MVPDVPLQLLYHLLVVGRDGFLRRHLARLRERAVDRRVQNEPIVVSALVLLLQLLRSLVLSQAVLLLPLLLELFQLLLLSPFDALLDLFVLLVILEFLTLHVHKYLHRLLNIV